MILNTLKTNKKKNNKKINIERLLAAQAKKNIPTIMPNKLVIYNFLLFNKAK